MTRLGFIYPGGGAEYEYYLFAERHGFQAFLVGSRIPGGDDHTVEALRQTARIEHIVEAGRHLVPLRPDAVVWACTSGSFILGRTGAEAQVEALSVATGRPATSTSLAFVAALTRLRATRVAVLATYPEPASRAFAAFLAEHDIAVVSLDWLDASTGFDAAAIGGDRLLAAAEGVALEAEALLIPDTALPTLEFLVTLEQRIERPVLTANQVTLWAGLGLAGRPQRVPGYGRLFGLGKEESAL